MAIRITDAGKIPYKSSGIYFKEVDLTVLTQTVGTFSAASIGLTERGPAFQILSSSTYSDRAFKFGELNPKYKSSYFAKQYLEQGSNYKEIRLLGLEGYTDNVGYAINYSIEDATAYVPGTSALVLDEQGLACILKKRSTDVTGRPAISTVEVSTTSYVDPLSSNTVTAATDYLFALVITYVDNTVDTVVCSLRPESDQYIVKKFGTSPLDGTKVLGKAATLWVDFIIPSVKVKPTLDSTLGYYYPGTTQVLDSLDLLTGNVAFGSSAQLQSVAITGVSNASNVVTITVGSDITSWLSNNGLVKISNVSGTGNITQANGVWKAASVAYDSQNTVTTFILKNSTTNANLQIAGSITFNGSSNPTVENYHVVTYEGEILDFSTVGYQTPVTPWFVSDADLNGDYKKLFRFWSISDGKAANTEIKIEIKNINPSGNSGKGSFDVVVRQWSDREDLQSRILESYTGLTLDENSTKYIGSMIGDGETYEVKSSFIFVEINTNEDLTKLVPYGCLGYPNVTGNYLPDLIWTNEYDLDQSLNKQTLGLANNVVNCLSTVFPDNLSFRRSVGKVGKGFHLNPNNNTSFVSAASHTFAFASQNIYKTSLGGSISATEKVSRSRFVVDFFGGFDGWNVYSERTWSDASSKDYEALQIAVDLFSDKEAINSDFTVLVTPDLNFTDHLGACDLVNTMVINRGDALYIPDFAYDESADVNAALNIMNASTLKSNSTAVYFPYVQIKDPINIKPVWIGPSLIALGTITYTANNENIWQPPAGSLRTVTNNLIRTRRRLAQNDRELLKGGNINGITTFPGSGYEITEARTTQEVFSALSFIHNRLLICYAKKILNQTLRPLLFQLNGQVTENAFLSTVRPIFDRIKKLNGIEDFSVDVTPLEETNDRTTLAGNITIVPLYAVEKIEITFTLQNGAINYNNQ